MLPAKWRWSRKDERGADQAEIFLAPPVDRKPGLEGRQPGEQLHRGASLIRAGELGLITPSELDEQRQPRV